MDTHIEAGPRHNQPRLARLANSARTMTPASLDTPVDEHAAEVTSFDHTSGEQLSPRLPSIADFGHISREDSFEDAQQGPTPAERSLTLQRPTATR